MRPQDDEPRSGEATPLLLHCFTALLLYWLFPTGSAIVSSPVVVGEIVYIASGLNLYAIDLKTGTGVWRFSTTDAIDASPAVANEMLYIGSRDGFL